ncbi:hypothetical protein S40288_06224 [Stachybotrys chartarum IBT 40288]|nr:hypothetical protein S40288_06224 [Stachybotrys chartarum IBT 40288]
MAVKDDAAYHPTDAIVSRNKRKHYRIPVRSQHWQLRSLISAEKRNYVYFPGGNSCNHIQRLNTTTHECETLKLLTFAPRCLVAENGWVCCGSENGEFVAIQLSEAADLSTNPALSRRSELESRLPLSSDSPPESVLSLLFQRRPNKSLIAKSIKLAKDRVNCITLWFPSADSLRSAAAYTQPLAVLANNDRTVTLVGLNQVNPEGRTEPLEVIQYPDFVNRAIISPDGRLLVAILDDPYLYVHERVLDHAEDSATASSRAGDDREYGWVLKQKYLLKSQRLDDRSDSRGSFAACFSSSGTYLAVGTQHGTISIFDATALADPVRDPLITTFKSSRPESGPGAIRDMAFCPGPLDILAWTEDRGNIGVADVRQNFVVRQIVDINAEADFEHINILDRNTIDPRLLENRTQRNAMPSASSVAAETSRQGEERTSQSQSPSDVLNSPLRAHETLVLEAIQGERRRRERAIERAASGELSSPRPADMAWTASGGLRSQTNGADTPSRPRERSSSVSRAMGGGIGDLLGNYREQHTTPRDRPPERMRSARQLLRDASERGQTNRRPESRWMERLGDSVAAMRERDRTDTSYLNVLDILQARERLTASDMSDDPSLLSSFVDQVASHLEESALRGTLAPDYGVFEIPPSSDNTAGLAWSEDGRTLYVGAQNGIYEFQINAQGRKYYPSIKLS